jgi:subtilisin family serine protease
MGFWDEYSNEDENYTTDQMNGWSTVITKVCQKWAMKGMIIVNSAGNTGEYAWKIIWAPSDAPDVIAVGAARFPDKVFKASYSGRGNPDISYVKPELIAFSPWGTSFSANVVTGIVACMLQKDSTLTLHEIRDILFRSSTLYPYPNNYVGYGIPDARKIIEIMNDPERDVSTVTSVFVREGRYTIKTTTPNNVVFEKTDHYRVRRQYIDEAADGRLTVTAKGGIMFTTVVTGEKAWEICWE